MLEIGLCGKFLCTEISLFLYFTSIALWMCYKCRCNTATFTKIIKIWVFRVDPIYWSCRASAIYDLSINLWYILDNPQRVPALIHIPIAQTHCSALDSFTIFLKEGFVNLQLQLLKIPMEAPPQLHPVAEVHIFSNQENVKVRNNLRCKTWEKGYE